MDKLCNVAKLLNKAFESRSVDFSDKVGVLCYCRLMHFVSRFCALVCAALIFSAASYACDCGTCASPAESGKKFGVFQYIMKAEILASIENPEFTNFDENANQIPPLRQLLLRPVRTLRGPKREWLLVHDNTCTVGGDVGDVVNVAAYLGDDGQLHASNCSAICARGIGHSFGD